mgnify:CR=1 FL=1|tara:strand:+ start:1162 stop:1425 length:264 start_codon:yes stop_codon:yes gene_type:complete
MIPLRKAAAFISVPIFAVFAAMAGWNHFAGDEQKWVHYEHGENMKILSEHSSHEDCSIIMRSHGKPSGCRRIDGPFGLLNRITDSVL